MGDGYSSFTLTSYIGADSYIYINNVKTFCTYVKVMETHVKVKHLT